MSYSSLSFWLHSVSIAAPEFSLAVGAALGCGPQAAELGLSAAACGPVAPRHVEASRPRDGTRVLCAGRQRVIHGATRKVLKKHFLRNHNICVSFVSGNVKHVCLLVC